MTKSTCLVAVFILCVVSVQAQSNPGLFRCKDRKHTIDLSINNSGQAAEGPVCAQIVVNVVRYGADFGKTVSYTAGANLPSIFPSSFSTKTNPPSRAGSLNGQFMADFTAIQ